MKEYTGDRIRNVAIVGHGGAGTTSVTEGLLYRSGAITRMGKVEDGATTTDYEPEEIKRGVSVNATLAPVEWRDTKINFIDTPGFADFVAEVKGAFRAVDSALIVVWRLLLYVQPAACRLAPNSAGNLLKKHICPA